MEVSGTGKMTSPMQTEPQRFPLSMDFPTNRELHCRCGDTNLWGYPRPDRNTIPQTQGWVPVRMFKTHATTKTLSPLVWKRMA